MEDEIKKGQIQAVRFSFTGCDIIFVYHGFNPADMLVFIAESTTSVINTINRRESAQHQMGR